VVATTRPPREKKTRRQDAPEELGHKRVLEVSRLRRFVGFSVRMCLNIDARAEEGSRYKFFLASDILLDLLTQSPGTHAKRFKKDRGPPSLS
jgi:hypothetical protein